MPSFGEKLKQEREKRKISLEDISVSTKIGTRMLQALEENKFNQLPGGIFNKGFVRAYSRCVGLDEDQAVADYLQASGDAPSVSAEIAARERELIEGNHEEEVSRIESSSDSPNRQIVWGLFAAILLIVALVLFFWSHRQSEHGKLTSHTTPAVEAPPAGASTGANSSGAGGSVSANSVSPSNPPSAQSSTTHSAIGSPAHAQQTTPKPASTRGAPANPPAPTPIPGQFIVVVQAREQSWVSILADGERVPSELLEPGSERAVQARREVIVKAGNAGGVDFLFNGKKLVVGGEFGEVKTVTFGPRGVVPNVVETPPTP